jgi:hypothetical protein
VSASETLYIKGIGYNFAAAVRRQPSSYHSEIIKCCGSDVDASLWKFSGETLRVVLKQPAQRFRLLQATEICGKSVEVTEPWSVSTRTQAQVRGILIPRA